MYSTFLALHSVFRWLVLISMLYAIVTSTQGFLMKRPFSKKDAMIRTVAGAITHTQLLIGFILYFVLSPVTQHFMASGADGNHQLWFFGIYHIAMMFIAVMVMTIGSSISKRAKSDKAKFKNIMVYFTVALILILLAIPWFRPVFRNF